LVERRLRNHARQAQSSLREAPQRPIVCVCAVAAQALAGRACFLTIWQNDLTASVQPATPLIVRWIDQLVYWPLPVWVFAALYVLVFTYALALLWLVPPQRPRSEAFSRHTATAKQIPAAAEP
jgi:hypothetical protein